VRICYHHLPLTMRRAALSCPIRRRRHHRSFIVLGYLFLFLSLLLVVAPLPQSRRRSADDLPRLRTEDRSETTVSGPGLTNADLPRVSSHDDDDDDDNDDEEHVTGPADVDNSTTPSVIVLNFVLCLVFIYTYILLYCTCSRTLK